MDEKMSDKKEWRAILIDRKSLKKFFNLSIEPIEGMDLTFVEIEAYESEKQRADSLQEKLDDEADLLVKTHNKLMEQRQRADRLETERNELLIQRENCAGENIKLKQENQKLKEALEKIACYVKPYDLTSEPIKMIETEEAMIAKEALK